MLDNVLCCAYQSQNLMGSRAGFIQSGFSYLPLSCKNEAKRKLKKLSPESRTSIDVILKMSYLHRRQGVPSDGSCLSASPQ